MPVWFTKDGCADCSNVRSMKRFVSSDFCFQDKMVQSVLLLLLLAAPTASGYGFKHCSQNFPENDLMWCFNQNIANLSNVVSMIPDNITKINLSKNKIGVIPTRVFSHLHRLKDLDLSQNKLVSLKGGEFEGLGALGFLNLSCNNISDISTDAFDGLTRLKSLILTYNNLQTFSPRVFKYLPAIQEIILSLNKLETLNCAESGGSSTLQTLNLHANNIQKVNVSCFPALKSIRLSNNSRLQLQADVFASNPKLNSLLCQGVAAEVILGLSMETKKTLSWVAFSLFAERSPLTICGLIKGMGRLIRLEVDLKGSKLNLMNSSLLDCPTPQMVIIEDANLGNVANLNTYNVNTYKLYLNNCGLKQISRTTFQGYRGLVRLQLNRNKLHIDQDTFTDMSRLKVLGLDSNKLRDIDPTVLAPLKTLTCLSLTKNEITELTTNMFSGLTELEQLYLQFNLLKYITKKPFSKLRKLTRLNLSLNIIDFIEEGSFQDLASLDYLDLSGNRIKRLTPRILYGLVNLKSFILYNNRLHFKSYEAPFTNLSSLQYVEMNYQGPAGRGIGNIGPHFFQGPRNLTTIVIGHSNTLDFDPDAFVPVVNLEKLYIAGAVLRRTNLSRVLSPLKKLEKLTLYRLDLDALPANLLPPGNTLKVLQVKANHLRTVDKALLDALPRLQTLDVSENPLTCSCDNAWFKDWAIQNTETQVQYLYSLHCDNDWRSSSYLYQFDDKACSYEQVSFTLFISTTAFNLVFVCVCLIWHTQAPALRYLLLVLRAKLRGRRGEGAAKFQYDAFISYSSPDEAWVMEQMVPNLERPGMGVPKLRLCLHHRDFRPGAAVLENIEAAIYSSRHTICVVTRHFLQSEWCTVEFQLASLRLLFDGSDVLILVFLEELPEHCLSPYTRLRKIVRKNTYLLWPEDPKERDVFWVRLIDALRNNEDERGGGRGEDEMARLIG